MQTWSMFHSSYLYHGIGSIMLVRMMLCNSATPKNTPQKNNPTKKSTLTYKQLDIRIKNTPQMWGVYYYYCQKHGV